MMEDSSVFDKLVVTLSDNERMDLLRELKNSLALKDEPLIIEDPEAEEFVNLEKEYGELSLFSKLLLFLRGLFSGKERLVLVEELLLQKLERKIRSVNPGIIDFTTRRFLKVMYDYLLGLQNAARFFRGPIESIFDSEKMDFFVFLAGMEMELVHGELMNLTDLKGRSRELRKMQEYEIAGDFEHQFETILNGISGMDKKRMYAHAKSLSRLKTLASFPFADVTGRFNKDIPSMDPWCSVQEIEKEIIQLGDVLAGLDSTPDTILVQALCLFQQRDLLETEDFDLRAELRTYIDKAEQALDTIREFNRIIPLATILKYVKNNINYLPTPVGGGEDWFQLFKRFWRERFDRNFQLWVKEQKRKRILEDALEFIGTRQFISLGYYRPGEWFEDAKLKYVSSVNFVKTFIEAMFLRSMQRPLKIIMLNGEFYKSQNLQEFTDSFNFLSHLPEQLEQVDREISSEGETGRAIQRVKEEVLPAHLKQRQVENQLKSVERQFEELIKASLKHMKQLKNVLFGIIHGEVGGKYDTLSNRQYIGGSENKKLLQEIEKGGTALERAGSFLGDLFDLDSAW